MGLLLGAIWEMSDCSAELRTFIREKVRACLVKNIKKTSPACQAAVMAQRDAERAKQRGN
jgi:hypothetical protein